jgi:hypothetical protein
MNQQTTSVKRRYFRFLIWLRKADNRVFTFVFFLMISGTLWFLNALSKTYITEIETPVQFVGVPRVLKNQEPFPATLTTQVSGRGFALLRYKIATPGVSYRYDVKPYFVGYTDNQDISIQIITQLAKKQIEQYYGGAFTVLDLYPRTINSSFSKIAYKKVAVKFHGELSFEPQYWQKGNTIIVPDSIEIGGPQNFLDTVREIRTVFSKIHKINKQTSKTFNLSQNEVLMFTQKDVQVTVDAEKFTESTLKVPIRVLNVPEKYNVMLFPDNVTVKFKIALDEYERVSAANFVPIIDYNQMKPKGTKEKIKVELVESPDNARNITIHPREVNYLIGVKR